MKITSLEPQRKNKERLNIYVDGIFRSGIDIGAAAKLGLYEGKEVSESDLAGIDTEDEYQKCMNAALGLASRRMQSEREYWQKLSKHFDKPVIGKVLDRLRVLGYADDQVFASSWVRARSSSRGYYMLKSELETKGIDKSIIEDMLSTLEGEVLLEAAITQARRKYKPTATKEENYSKVMGLLTRRGFSYSISKEAFDSINKTTD